MPISETSGDQTAAVRGENTGGGPGVVGVSKSWQGVHGSSESRSGVLGESKTGRGVHGISESSTGVNGVSKSWQGVHGSSESRSGVLGESKTGRGVHGISESSSGVNGVSETGLGVHGASGSSTGVLGESTNGIGVHGKGRQLAGLFEGQVKITGLLEVTEDIRLVNADCAELFELAPDIDAPPGTVVVLNEEGTLQPCTDPYDSRVVGVISGLGEYRPGIILDCGAARDNARPVALAGKVMCAVDARVQQIAPGDLLTTSATPGRAMAVRDRLAAVGSVVGKALAPASGLSAIPMLVVLQ